MIGYSPKLPLARDTNDGLYGMNKTAAESIRQDLKMLLLTNPGERMMIPDYGVGLRKILFEQNILDTRSYLIDRINQQIKNYMNFLFIQDLVVDFNNSDENSVSVTIYYNIPYITNTQEMILDLQR